VPLYRENLANGRHSLANLLGQRGAIEEAEAVFRLALEVSEKLTADFPAVPVHRMNLANTHHNFGSVLAKGGKSEPAEAAYRRAMEIQTKLATEFPALPEYRQDLAKSYGSLGNLLVQVAEPSKAEAAYRRALEIQEKLAADFPAVPAYQSVLGTTLSNLAVVLQSSKQWEQTCALFERDIIHQRKALDADPKNAIFRQSLRMHLVGLSNACLTMGDHAVAAATALELPKLYREGWQQYERAATLLARCVSAALGDATLDPDDREQIAESYAAQSVALLRTAIANGYKDAAKLKDSRDFSSLQDRTDFQALVGAAEEQPGAK
jgi:tetratricopeptide (TPR) repeat protein